MKGIFNKPNIAVIIIIVIVIFGSLLLGSSLYNAMSKDYRTENSGLPIITIQNLFLDVDGDGRIDFVKYMEVILNNQENVEVENLNQGQ